MIDQQTAQDLDWKVAEAFRWYWNSRMGHWEPYENCTLEETFSKRDWQPHKNLSQITRYGVPWLNDMFGGVQLFFFTDDADLAIITNCGREYLANGQGEHADEKIAWALSEVISG